MSELYLANEHDNSMGDAALCAMSQTLMGVVERRSSAVECGTRNRESPGSNPPLLPFRSLGISVFSTTPQLTVSLTIINL